MSNVRREPPGGKETCWRPPCWTRSESWQVSGAVDAKGGALEESSRRKRAVGIQGTKRMNSELAAELRQAFSGIVAGNVKAYGIEQVAKYGPYKLKGDTSIMQEMEKLLKQFVYQKRMKLNIDQYVPCYEIER